MGVTVGLVVCSSFATCSDIHSAALKESNLPTLVTTGVNVPSAFPATSYDKLHNHIVSRHTGATGYKQYSGGWNAVSYRYAEALECAVQFEQHFLADGAAPPPLDRYKQERTLFDFYGSAVSALEACAFSIFAMASLNHSANFQLSNPADERNVTPSNLRNQLNAHFAGDQFTAVWASLLQDQRYRDLHSTRNVLTHRTAVARHHHLGGPKSGTAVWELTGQTISKDLLKAPASELTALFALVVPAAEQFALNHC